MANFIDTVDTTLEENYTITIPNSIVPNKIFNKIISDVLKHSEGIFYEKISETDSTKYTIKIKNNLNSNDNKFILPVKFDKTEHLKRISEILDKYQDIKNIVNTNKYRKYN
jgi:hypothetical protein